MAREFSDDAPDLPEDTSPASPPPAPDALRRKWLLWGGLALVVLGVVTLLYTDFLGARVLTRGPRVPVSRGEELSLFVSPAAGLLKAEICRQSIRNRSCTPLPTRTDSRRVLVQIPLNYPLGNAILKVVGARQQVLFIQRVVVVPPRLRPLPTSPATPPNPYGPTPTPPGPYGPTATPSPPVNPYGPTAAPTPTPSPSALPSPGPY